MGCDPKLRKELDRISLEIDLEDTIAEASEVMELEEIFERAKIRGEAYSIGYVDAWWQSAIFYAERRIARIESIDQKHKELGKRWGLDRL